MILVNMKRVTNARVALFTDANSLNRKHQEEREKKHRKALGLIFISIVLNFLIRISDVSI